MIAHILKVSCIINTYPNSGGRRLYYLHLSSSWLHPKVTSHLTENGELIVGADQRDKSEDKVRTKGGQREDKGRIN